MMRSMAMSSHSSRSGEDTRLRCCSRPRCARASDLSFCVGDNEGGGAQLTFAETTMIVYNLSYGILVAEWGSPQFSRDIDLPRRRNKTWCNMTPHFLHKLPAKHWQNVHWEKWYQLVYLSHIFDLICDSSLPFGPLKTV